jgi:hypothetical protein
VQCTAHTLMNRSVGLGLYKPLHLLSLLHITYIDAKEFDVKGLVELAGRIKAKIDMNYCWSVDYYSA